MSPPGIAHRRLAVLAVRAGMRIPRQYPISNMTVWTACPRCGMRPHRTLSNTCLCHPPSLQRHLLVFNHGMAMTGCFLISSAFSDRHLRLLLILVHLHQSLCPSLDPECSDVQSQITIQGPAPRLQVYIAR